MYTAISSQNHQCTNVTQIWRVLGKINFKRSYYIWSGQICNKCILNRISFVAIFLSEYTVCVVRDNQSKWMPLRYSKIIDVWYVHSVTQDEKREILPAMYMLGCSHQYKWKWIMFQKRTSDIFFFLKRGGSFPSVPSNHWAWRRLRLCTWSSSPHEIERYVLWGGFIIFVLRMGCEGPHSSLTDGRCLSIEP